MEKANKSGLILAPIQLLNFHCEAAPLILQGPMSLGDFSVLHLNPGAAIASILLHCQILLRGKRGCSLCIVIFYSLTRLIPQITSIMRGWRTCGFCRTSFRQDSCEWWCTDGLDSLLHTYSSFAYYWRHGQTFSSSLELNKAITPPEGRQELEDNKYLSPNLFFISTANGGGNEYLIFWEPVPGKQKLNFFFINQPDWLL